MHIAFIHQKKGQYPKRAFSISTIASDEDAVRVLEKCQCPKRAYSISTGNWINLKSPFQSCVNALNGLTPFLRKRDPIEYEADIVSMP